MSRSKTPKRKNVKPVQKMNGEKLIPRTETQKDYIRAIAENNIVYCTGDAGTGKSAVAIAMASQYLIRGEFERLIITRPCVETSKKSLGALPGGLMEKFDPYLKAAKKELKKFLGEHYFLKFTSEGIIQFLPLEFMRGETFDNAIMILDEAQNADIEQIKMFVTRMGENSKVLINGDIEQSDNRRFSQNTYSTDLEFIIKKTESLKGFAHITFSDADIVRNPILQSFLRALK